MSKLAKEFSDWMHKNFTGQFLQLKWRGGPGDEDMAPDLRKKWERKLGHAGWLGVGWPEQYGGRGASLEDLVAYNEEYARHGGPGRAGHIGETLFAPTLITFGTEAQKEQFLPGIRLGETYWAQGYSEPGAGSDLSSIKTKARLEQGEWIIEGQKIWTSNAQDADWCFVIARAVAGSKGREGLAFLLVPLHQKGVTIRPIKQITGSAEFNEVYFDQARTPAENILGEVGDGWKIAMALLGFERGASTLGQQMIFRNEYEQLVDAATENGAIRDPFIRQRLAKAYAGLKIMRFSALRILDDMQQDAAGGPAWVSKIYWASWHRDLGELAMDILGPEAERISGDGLNMAQRLFLFSRADTIYAGTNQIQRNIIAERYLGMPKEPRGIVK